MIQKENLFLFHPSLSTINESEVVYIQKNPTRSEALIRAQRKYYQKNKEKLTQNQLEYNKVYNKVIISCACGDKYTRAAKFHHMKSNRHATRMQNIKDGKFAGETKSLSRVNCSCGGHYLYKDRHQHFRTKKHIKYINNIEQEEIKEI